MGNILYHGTSAKSALSILTNNILELGNFFNLDDFKDNKRYVCLTRDYNFIKSMPSFKRQVIFILDRDKLRQNYRISPITDYKNFSKKDGRFKDNSKAEEVIDKPINNIIKYIIKLIIDDSIFDNFKIWLDENNIDISIIKKSDYEKKNIVEKIIKKGNKWQVQSEKGKNIGKRITSSNKLTEMVGKAAISNDRILKLIDDCITKLKNIGYYDPEIRLDYDNIRWEEGKTTSMYGTCFWPRTDKLYDYFRIVLNSEMFEEDDDAIINTILHELCHYITDTQQIADNVVYFDGDKWRFNKKLYDKPNDSPHGRKWKDIAKNVSSRLNLKYPITALERRNIHNDVLSYKDSNIKYIIKCKNCGQEYKYQKKTDFAENPNQRYGNSKYRYWCGKCRAEGQFEIIKSPDLKEALTKQQENYFKNSKIRDKQGNLLICYHGTTNPGFKKFNPSAAKSQFGSYKFKSNVNYFTLDRKAAGSFTYLGYEDETLHNVYACYLNIENPFIVDNKTSADIRSSFNIKDNRIRDKQIDLFTKFWKKWVDRNISKEDLNQINSELDVFNMKITSTLDRKDNEGSFYDKDENYYDLRYLGNNSFFGSDKIILYTYSLPELFDSDMYQEMRDAIVGNFEDDYEDYFLTTDDLVKYVLTMNIEDGTNYDGIIIPDIIDTKQMFGEPSTDIITLKSANQIKLITNTNPTKSNYIDEKYYI